MAMTLLTTNSDTNQTSMSFTSGIDSTYKLYIFKWFDVGPATDNTQFSFNGSDDTSSWSYDITKTTTYLNFGSHLEDDSSASTNYSTGGDIAQGTGYQTLTGGLGNDADSSAAGTLWLFNPSNTTYVKHFYARIAHHSDSTGNVDQVVAGYFNTTAAITAIDFKMASGNFDGTIKMYGVG